MTVTVFLLLVWTAGHEGWIAVPNLPNKEACHTLGRKIKPSIVFENPSWSQTIDGKCIPYEAVVAREMRL